MLSSAAARLAAIEALCPTAALVSGGSFPTMAGALVLDSRSIALQEIRSDQPYTPVIGVFSGEERSRFRGSGTDAQDLEHTAVLEFVAELAVSSTDDGATFADAMLGDDSDARLVLDALSAQIDYTLEQSETGYAFRRMVSRVTETERIPFAVPQLGLRYQRVTIRKTCMVRTPDYDVPAGQLPEPMRTMLAALPAASYARGKLIELAAKFRPDLLPALERVTVSTGPFNSGI